MGRVNQAMQRAADAAKRTESESSAPAALDLADALQPEFEVEAALLPSGNGNEPAADLLLRTTAQGARLRAPELENVPAAPAVDEKPTAPVVNDAHHDKTLFERVESGLEEKTVIDDRIMPASKEQYRKLAAALHRAQETNGLKVVMIASAAASEGKTLTACNLALTLSESYKRKVLIIDADLRRPMMHTVFQLEGTQGLADGLEADDDRKLPLHVVSPTLTVLTAGQPSQDPMAGLTSVRMRRVLDEARAAFDWVIVDTPPLGLMSDASLLASMVDGTVMVIKAGHTPYDLVRRASESISESGQLLGVVLNRATTVDRNRGYGYSDYQAYYGASPGNTAEAP